MLFKCPDVRDAFKREYLNILTEDFQQLKFIL